MNLKCGIICLTNVGKSTLFNALTGGRAEVANYAFCTVDPNVGIVPVPDDRLPQIQQAAGSKDRALATIQFVDIAGLVKGANRGEGLGNQFLSHIREMDTLLHVLRGFEDGNVAHVSTDVNPLEDIEVIDMELILKDLETIERRMEKTEKMLKTNKKEYREEMDNLVFLKDQLERGVTLRDITLDSRQQGLVSELNLLTVKPVLYVINIDENSLLDEKKQAAHSELQQAIHDQFGGGCLAVCARLEAELLDLDLEEQKEFYTAYDLDESGLDRLIKSVYQLMDLITFFTANENEARSWIVEKGTTAKRGAGKIHTDMERGFIRAEVIPFSELVDAGSFAAAKRQGLLRSEGKEYQIQEGDVITFKFNV